MTFTSTRLKQPMLLTGVFHFIIIGIAAEADTPEVWPYALASIAVVSFFAWVATYRRYRQIHDLPTSKVASAAQGYVELFGRSAALPGVPVVSKLSSTPCCWYSFEIEEKTSDDKWKTVDKGTSVEHFLLVDDSGECVISPDGAEVLTRDHMSWTEGSYRYSESLLLPRGVLYSIGEFSTTTAAVIAAREERADVSDLLNDWKKEQKKLLERFDLNRDGQLDMKEWELARLQAQREVRKKHAETRSRSVEGVHLLRKPRDGRLFLIANEVPDKLGSHYRLWSWVHLAIFLGAGNASLFMF